MKKRIVLTMVLAVLMTTLMSIPGTGNIPVPCTHARRHGDGKRED
ncbi:hypothetical protein [Desulfobacula sp.]|nr:hypothetical protein [Desulfobacula sp.]